MSEPLFTVLPDDGLLFTVLPDSAGQFVVLPVENVFVVDLSLFEARKHPGAALPFVFDWGEWLDARGGEVIDSVVWTIAGPDSSLVELSTGGTGRKRTIYLGGGTGGAVYAVSAKITTSGSPSMDDERTLNVTMEGVTVAPPATLTVLDIDGIAYEVPLQVLDSDGVSYTVTSAVLDIDGTGYVVI